ncbi:DUF5665 domain-containing protein [Clostridium formicaceticum]|uniref:Uncharacterized protein n=1 Tax=Clostridium formicaceticum TaxID=1497 RepID=A0AAC9RMD8_9CLOT|nr:DUF5665 domain-containing protein [Clostridium formicaceticum]AOY77383.1 hypothetical protein BJL90_16915 [Clostridium formicaceticum]ARE87933.1 hypothetical protein CLFO_23330 [Clostridium formicaceticum]
MPNRRKKPNLGDKLENLSRKMDNMRVAEYVELNSNPKRLIFMNFLLGVVRGIGMGIGFTLLTGLIVALLAYILRSWVNLPYIGKIIADLIKIIENYN